jgi:predicted ATPase
MNKGHINTGVLYDNVMNKFVWGNVNHPDVFLDDYNKKAIRIIQARYMFARLAEALVNEGQNKKAEEVIDKMFELFPDKKMPLTYDSFPAVEQYFRAGATEKGTEKTRQMAENSFQMLNYYFSLPGHFAHAVQEEQEREMAHLQNLLVLTRRYNLQDLNSEIDGRLQQMIQELSGEIQ